MQALRSAFRLRRQQGPETRRLTAAYRSCRRISSSISASDAAQRLLDLSNNTITRRQVLDANQLRKLGLTLGRRQLSDIDISERSPATGTPVPPGWHLVYFTPDGFESELGPDGTDITFNAPAPFTRRMWAGGRMKWSVVADATSDASIAPVLRIGDEVEERTRIVSATAKKSKSVGEMVLVEVEKQFWGPNGLSLVDQRSWVFRPEIVPGSVIPPKPLQETMRGPSSIKDGPATENGIPSRQIHWSPIGLFRFSALTFNAHMIHYNENWTKVIEGHAAEVVHGPLNLINILDYWGDIHGNGSSPLEIAYRALAPIYAGQPYTIRTVEILDDGDRRSWKVTAERDGTVCMTAEIWGSIG